MPRLERVEVHGRRHRQRAAVAQRLGGGRDALGHVAHLASLNQTQVARWQRVVLAAGQRAVPGNAGRQALVQHLRVSGAAHAIGQHAGQPQARAVGGQPVGYGAEGLRHRRGIDHRQHWQPEVQGQIGTRRRAIVQTHDAFDQDQVSLRRRAVQQPGAVRGAAHPQVELLHRRAAGAFQHHRIQEVGTCLEDAHAPALAAVRVRQRGGDGGLALARSRGRDQQGRAWTRLQAGGNNHGREANRQARSLDMIFPGVTALLQPRWPMPGSMRPIQQASAASTSARTAGPRLRPS
nr:hypothetical protein T29Apl_00008 [Methylibium sp. T29]